MAKENEKEVVKLEDTWGLKIDLATGEIETFPVKEPPESHGFGQYTSHITGSKDRIESLKSSLISSSLSKLRRVKNG